ncbi:mechanosensitive ion channel family protein [Spirulina subsalsa FACHB-351]|uniref:Mechanosensitive ion channel family protein n=1 Tax=Spirulina subsalsa FACHB-351 TaxID=234711 RepID=A0ABT3L205_9CYAN|nr:mechanosensitive ion channel family protein [Spirulina subsalsa]MCW6035505.1 mechanosensitive ion channel family protein [Spirulina subsalsa FACHB-351]
MQIFQRFRFPVILRRLKGSFFLLLFTLTLVLTGVGMPSAIAQLPLERLTTQFPEVFTQISDEETVRLAWIRLDGRPLFQIAEGSTPLAQRQRAIQHNLRLILEDYLSQNDPQLQIAIRPQQDTSDSLNVPYESQTIIIEVNNQELAKILPQDARQQYSDPLSYAETIRSALLDALPRARREREAQSLQQQLWRAFAILGLTVALSFAVHHLNQRLPHLRPIQQPNADTPITTQLTRQRQDNLKAVQKILGRLAQVLLWGVSGLLLLSLFPYTRGVQVWLTSQLRIYFFVSLIILLTYVAIRLAYILIDRFIETFVISAQLIPRRDQRMNQRVSTISGVTKGITTIVVSIIGIFAILIQLGVNIGPLVAGAGLIGVAISLASQNLIKDAINGFLILVEDQYAVGDVIGVGSVAGMVEKITLRITQLRDTEQRLITIPNSEIRIVSNLSSRHSQADIKIPVAYSANVDQALEIVKQTSWGMRNDPDWQSCILSDPLILGLDEFTIQGMIIRVWMRTEPLQQWNVAREFRRRIKQELDRAGIPLMVSQYEFLNREGSSEGMSAIAGFNNHHGSD